MAEPDNDIMLNDTPRSQFNTSIYFSALSLRRATHIVGYVLSLYITVPIILLMMTDLNNTNNRI